MVSLVPGSLRHYLCALIVFAVACLLAYILLSLARDEPGPIVYGAEPLPVPQLYQGIPLDAHLLRLDRRALDEAYHTQVIFLFTVCLKDGCKDSQYFSNGMRNARRFYAQAASQIAEREKELIEKGFMEEAR